MIDVKTRLNTVFLVDDDADDQEIFLIALKEVDESIVCVMASDGMEALSKLNDGAFRPDCIFLDLNMPRMDGKQCLLELKAKPGLRHIPVIIYSTSSESRDMAETLAMGASDFMTKPPEIDELIENLRLVLEKYT